MIAALSVLLVLVSVSSVLTLRIPPNPCPNVFSYNRVSYGREVFGQVRIPYDGANKLNMHVNASFVGSFERPNNVQLKLTTPPNPTSASRTKTLIYNVYFPYQDVIPRITQITYNGRTFCSGPQEPLVAGGSGVTNTWTSHQYFFFNDRGAAVAPASEAPAGSEIDTSNFDQDKLIKVSPDSDLDVKSQYTGECGIASVIVPLVLGGEEVSDGEFPWLAAMFVAKGSGYEYKCTANLISQKHVVTAARCVQYYKVQIVKVEDILLVFGKADVSQWAINGAVTRGASNVQTHPEFDQNSAHGDISVITLNRPVEFSKAIAPVCLWDGDESVEGVVGKEGSLAGWGINESAEKSHQLSTTKASFVSFPVVSTDECLFSNFTYATVTSDMTFCAGRRDGKGPCVGDSGAGFAINRGGKFYLRGLASLTLSDAQGKCDLKNFVIFCDVAQCRDWILSAMKN